MGSNRFRFDMPKYIEFYLDGRLRLDEMISSRIRARRGERRVSTGCVKRGPAGDRLRLTRSSRDGDEPPSTIEAPARVLAIGASGRTSSHFAERRSRKVSPSAARRSRSWCAPTAARAATGGDLAERRRREAGRAAGCSASAPLFLGFRDGDLIVDDHIRKALVQEIRRVGPTSS